MARSERAKQLQRYLESTGRKLPAQRTGANRNAYIDFDVTGKADLSEEGGPLSPGNGLPLGGLIQGGEGYGLYGGLHSEQIKLGIKRNTKDAVDPIRKKRKTRKIVKERIVPRRVVRREIKDRDYVATITEVLDANRVRVNLTYNDGVNKVKHKGADQSAEKFTYWRVNYDKSNVNRFKTYMVNGNQFYLLVNDKLGADITSRKVKLKQPLADNLQKLDRVYFVEKRLPDYNDTVKLVPFVDRPDDGIFLRIPNLNSNDNPINFEGTNFQTHNDLLGSDSTLNFDLEEKLISGSLLNIQPNVDYQKTSVDISEFDDDTGFGNYIHFSNAESRLRNFKKKLDVIENHNETSSSLLTISSSADRVSDIEKRRQRVINSFDPFEHYMYFESSSYVSSSNGQFHDTSWPKTNSSTPYTLAAVGSSQANTWYNNMIASASRYDQGNVNNLRNSLPEHVYSDTKNNVFLEFMDMVGQQFDEIWGYVKGLTDVNKRVEKLSEGISKDVAKAFAQTLGLKLYSGNDLVNLPEYLLGKNPDGTTKYETASEQLTEEIWKRILANLPFFIKSKGTERAIKGLLSCYGIPSSILRVREYGGPENGKRVSYEIKRKFTRALDFKGSQYVKLPWANISSHKPETIEFRFRTPYQVNQTLIHKDGDWAIELINSGSTEYGNVRLSVSASTGVETVSSSKLRFFDDDMWSVMLRRKSSSGADLTADTGTQDITYELFTSQYDSTRQRIVYKQSSSIDIDGDVSSSYNTKFTTTGNLVLGRSGSNEWNEGSFSGSLMEFRLWSEPLSASVFDNHTRTPKAYNGNTTESAYDNLLIRLPLDDNRNLQTNPTASNITYLKTYSGDISGSNVNGFTGNFFRTLTDQEKLKVPNVGIRRNATKIRLEDNNKPATSTLNRMHSVETSPQDEAPIDINKLGVYFSPTDVINEDIIYSVADFNFDDLIGDPRDEFENNYRGLSGLRHSYFKRYGGKSNNFFDYLRILNFYDDSIFQVLKQFVPARAQATFGNLIEPNILERNKQFKRRPQQTQPYFENADDFEQGIRISHFISGSNNNTIRPSGEFPYHEGTLNYHSDPIYRGLVYNTLVHINEINPRDIDSSTYATGSVTKGQTEVEFRESVQPNLMNNRISLYNKVREFYYTSSLSVATANGYGHLSKNVDGLYIWSSSLEPTDVQAWYQDTISERLFFKGTQLRSSTAVSTDGTFDESDSPVQITFTNPTKLTTQQPGESRLKTD